MKIRVVVVGRSRGAVLEGIREFETRAGRYWKLEVIEVDSGVARGGSRGEAEVRRAEAERIRGRIPDGGRVWALSRKGTALDSDRFAEALDAIAAAGSRTVTFLIGGAFGLDDSLLDGADRTLSLSSMTFPHAVARLVLAEQLYRAGTILRGEPYHKGDGT